MAKIEKSVYRLVVAEVGDYERMRRKLDKGNLTKDQIIGFTRKVAAIDNALCAVCEGEGEKAKALLLSDIANDRGYYKSSAREIYVCKGTFDRRKRDAIEMIATMMGLI